MSKELKSSEKELIKSIQSEDYTIVTDALQKIRKDGSCRILPDILDLLYNTEDSDIEAKIIEILFDLKEQSCAPVLIKYLEDEKLKGYKNFLIAAFWQSSLDGSEYLTEFVHAAIKEDYMVCLEALTVIENFDTTFREDEITECNADLEEAISEEESQDKKILLIHLQEVVNNLPVEEA